jgi:hypothetical protein
MQRLNTLWQLVSAASSVRDIAQQAKTWQFAVNKAMTFYLRAENASVHITRWPRPMIEVNARLQASFGWRIVTEQDEAGVYMVAKRRTVVGGLSSATFKVFVPEDVYLVLKLENGHVRLEHVNGTINIPPASADGQINIGHTP